MYIIYMCTGTAYIRIVYKYKIVIFKKLDAKKFTINSEMVDSDMY